jgi:hypothetical protein
VDDYQVAVKLPRPLEGELAMRAARAPGSVGNSLAQLLEGAEENVDGEAGIPDLERVESRHDRQATHAAASPA